MVLLFIFVAFAFGAIFGSFLNVCIHRIPRGESVVFPGSACPGCHRSIKAYDNIPVLSWLMLGGRCRQCEYAISSRYIAVEILTGLLFAVVFWRFGLSLSALKYCIFSFLITGLVFIDAEWKLLPDAFTLPGFLIGLTFSIFVPVNHLLASFWPGMITFQKFPQHTWRFMSFADSLLGAAIGASFIYGVAFLYLQARGIEGMGMGDVKLMAMVGAFLGTKLTVLTIFGASFAGTIFGLWTIYYVWQKRLRRLLQRHIDLLAARRRAWNSARMVYRYYQLPFGVFLGGMAMLALFFGNALMSWYWHRFL